jgi:hypothetical protein
MVPTITATAIPMRTVLGEVFIVTLKIRAFGGKVNRNRDQGIREQGSGKSG